MLRSLVGSEMCIRDSFEGEALQADFSSIGTKKEPYARFMPGRKINVSYNCADRWVTRGAGDTTAILWQGEDESEKREISFAELTDRVAELAASLQNLGVKKGSVVTLFMPMVPELAFAMLACSRIGAIHSVVFSAFSPDSLRNRIIDLSLIHI